MFVRGPSNVTPPCFHCGMDVGGVDVVADLTEVLARLAGTDPFAYGDGASILALERGLSSLSCTLSKAVASFADSGEWAGAGAQSAPAWIAASGHLPLGLVKGQLCRGRALPSMPVVAAAFGEGSIAPAHVDVLVKAAKAVAHADAEAFGLCEQALVEAAKELTFVPFANAVAYFTQMADPDGAEEADMARRARRNVYLTETVNGMYLGAMTLDPVSGAIVAGELERLEEELFEAEWAAAKETLGRDPKVGDLPRARPAPGRCPRRDGGPRQECPGGGPACLPPLQRLGGLRNAQGPHQPDRRGSGAQPRGPRALVGRGGLRTHRLLPQDPHRVLEEGTLLHRGDPPGHRSARPVLHPSFL